MLAKGKIPRSLRDTVDYFLVAYYFHWTPDQLDALDGEMAMKMLFMLDVLKDKLSSPSIRM